jgi:ATP-dependent Clp protease adaptor protein ClpS
MPSARAAGPGADGRGWGAGRARARHNGGVPTTLEPTRVVEPEQAESTAPDHPWIVIVWNDPVNLMSYVTYVLQKLFGYSLEKATELMLDVHHKGKAVVANGTREQAEMHVFRLHEHGLWATMEKDGGES